jgi:hypothetical protein
LENWRPFLGPQGIDLLYQPALTDPEYATLTSDASTWRKLTTLAMATARLAKPADHEGLVLVHRLRFPAALPPIDRRPLDVYDFDDAIFMGSTMAANRRFGWVKREAERSVAHMRAARLVIAGNPYLASYAGKWNQRVEVVPSCVDTNSTTLAPERGEETITVGWIGSSSTSPYLEPFLPLWSEFQGTSDRPVRLVLVGADPALTGPRIEHRPWSPEAERAALSELDVGVMPLPDNPWTRGKCGYKLLQYFAAAVPAIASPVGINAKMLAAGGGFGARTRADWLSHLRELVSSRATRQDMGRAGRALAEAEYSYTVWAPRLAELLRDLAN